MGVKGVASDKVKNVLINCQPVQDPDTGKVNMPGFSLKDNAIPLLLGGSMIALPTIAKFFNKDPVTGETIPGAAGTTLDASAIGSAPNGLIPGMTLVLGGDRTPEWIAPYQMLRNSVEFTSHCCPEDDETETLMNSASPSALFSSMSTTEVGISSIVTTPPPGRPSPNGGAWVGLPWTGSDKYYAQMINVSDKQSLIIHLHYEQLFLDSTETVSMADGSTVDRHCKTSGTVAVRWCFIDDQDEIIEQGTLTKTESSEFAFTSNFSIAISEAVREKNVVTLRVYRSDAKTSSTDVFFQGISWVSSGTAPPSYSEPEVAELPTYQVEAPADCVPQLGVVADDDKEPFEGPNGAFGTDACGTPDPVDPTDPEPDPDGCMDCEIKVDPKDGTGSGGDGGTDPDDAQAPTLVINGARDRTFDAGNSVMVFPSFTAGFGSEAADTSGGLTVTFTFLQGTGVMSIAGSATGVTFAWDAVAKKATITGPLSALNTVLGNLRYTLSDADKTSDLSYLARITDDATQKTGGVSGELKLLNQRVARPARAADSTVTIEGTFGSIQLKVGETVISGVVNYTTSLAATTQALVASINSTASAPDFTATYLTGGSFRIIAPTALGDAGNGRIIGANTTGAMRVSTTTKPLDGGVTKTEPFRSFGQKAWSIAKEVLPVLGSGLIAYTLYKSIAQMEIELPEDAVDEEGNVAVIYQGMKVRVPSNYDAVARTYTGEWDGETFAPEPVYTTNVAWCLLDFIESKRYGCGNALGMNARQWKRLYLDIYEAAKRCDEMVGDGRGESRPRYTLNTVLANMTRLQAMESIASAMHGQPVFTAYGLRIIQDRPDVPKMIVTNANAFAKGFDYSGGTLNASYNNVEVSWNNPDEFWRLRATEVMDGLDIVTNGERRNAVVAFGCTDEAQAIRHGAWILTTEKSNPLIVSYSASFDHAGLIPGDLVVLSDEMIEAVDETGQFGGRAKGTNTLDRPAPVDGTKTFWWIDEDGVLQHAVATVTGDAVAGVTLRPNQVFLTTEEDNAENNLWKILSITEHADGEFAVTAVKHDPNKYTDIDGFAAA